MGKVLKFDRKRRRKAASRSSTNGWVGAFVAVRPWLFLIALATVLALWREPNLVRTPDIMTTEPVTLDARWTPCGRGRGHYCVVDGDTIRIGSERVRILGLDTPEIEGRCDGESALALRAKERMLRWLNAGRVTTRTRIDRPRDQYGRQLREVYRHFPDGSREYAAEVLVAEGLARPYNGGSRGGWC